MVGFPNNHWLFLLKIISTWGVKWGFSHHVRKHPNIVPEGYHYNGGMMIQIGKSDLGTSTPCPMPLPHRGRHAGSRCDYGCHGCAEATCSEEDEGLVQGGTPINGQN